MLTYSSMGQSWYLLTNPAPHILSNNMALLSDGSVIIKTVNGGWPPGGYSGKSWNKLTPDSTGSYQNGTWSVIDSMHYDKIYFGTCTRSDGKVMTGHGIYFTDSNVAELYDPSTNTWSYADTFITNGVYPSTVIGVPTGLMKFDNSSISLPSGHQLTMLTPVITGTMPYFTPQTYFYKDTTLITPPIGTGTSYGPLWEFCSGMLLLPDGSILFCGGGKYPSIYK